jgi:hypothetical protein
MVSSISSTPPTLAVPSKPPANNPVAAKQIAGADRALNLLMKDTGLLETLAGNSSIYVPPGFSQVLSLLWGVMNQDGNSSISKRDIEHAVRLEGGSTSDADALYGQLNTKDPNGTNLASDVKAGDFASNAYLGFAVVNNLASEQDAVNQQRIQDQTLAVSNNSILLYIFGGGSSGANLNIFS